MTGQPEQLSCYTTGLLAYLLRSDPHATRRAVEAVRLAVRTDLADGVAFSQHERFDTPGSGGLGYAAAADPDAALDGVRAELRASGGVLVVANTAALHWSPSPEAAPHWLLVTCGPAGAFHVEDRFAALLPHGEQHPFAGAATAAEVTTWMRQPADLAVHVRRRDALALGTGTAVPVGPWRWLRRTGPVAGRVDGLPGPGRWIVGTAPSLRWLATRLADDAAALAECVDDLWAAGRHHVARAMAPGRAAAELPGPVVAAWGELPRTLRFAADSAARGRPRAAMVSGSLERLADLTERFENTPATQPGRAHVRTVPHPVARP